MKKCHVITEVCSRLAVADVFVAAMLCPTLCDPTDCSTPGFPVLRYLLEFAQIHIH